MTGSHIFSGTPFTTSEDHIEDAQYFKAKGRPHEGLRLIYVPRDEDDMQLHEINRRFDVS